MAPEESTEADTNPGHEGLTNYMATNDVSRETSASPTGEQADETPSTPAGTSEEDSTGATQPPTDEAKEATGEDTSGESTEETDDTAASEEDTENDILDSLGLTAKEPETLASMKVQLAASSRESIKNAQTIKGVADALASQGLKHVMTTGADGKPVMKLVASEEYVTKAVTDADLGNRTITSAEAAEAVEDTQAFAQKMYLEGARRGVEAATKSPVPTVSRDDVVIPGELLQLYTEEVKAEVSPKGNPLHPDYDKLEPLISRVVEGLPPAIASLMAKDADAYKAIMSMAYGKVAHVAAPLIAKQMDAKEQAQIRKEKAKTDVSLTSEASIAGKKTGESGRNGKVPDGVDPAAAAIMNATMQF